MHIIITLLLILAFSCSSSDYMVVLDAGSTGTRVYVYQILSTDAQMHPPNIKKLASCKDPDPNCSQAIPSTDKGIAMLSGQVQANMKAYLQPLIAYAKKNLPADQLANTPIFLRATAGVRNLSPATAQSDLMTLATIALQNSGFKSSSSAAVLSGFYEGVYSWINANIALNTLGLSSDKTYGIIEMGGASEQITFIPISQPNSFPLKIAGQNYLLYSYSYNHLGVNEAVNTTDNGIELAGCVENTNYTTCKSSWAMILNQNFACVPLCGLEGVNQSILPLNMNFKILGGAPSGISKSCNINFFEPQKIDEVGINVCNEGKTCNNYQGNSKKLCKLLALLSTELAGDLPSSFPGFGFSKNSLQIQAVDADGSINGQEVTWTKGFVVGQLLGIYE